jgi:hypothetical protein
MGLCLMCAAWIFVDYGNSAICIVVHNIMIKQSESVCKWSI